MRIPIVLAAAVVLQPTPGLSEISMRAPTPRSRARNIAEAMTSLRMRCR
jgi:hypothetical protein